MKLTFPTILVAIAFFSLLHCRIMAPASAESRLRDSSIEDEVPLPEYSPHGLNIVFQALPSQDSQASRGEDQSSILRNDSLSLDSSGRERYFLTVFGFQGNGLLNLPRFTHTWAVILQAKGINGNQALVVSSFAVSWDAADGDIGLGQGVEEGHNYSPKETLRLAAGMNVSIRRSRIVEINDILFGKFQAQRQKLELGEASQSIRYRMTDTMESRLRVRRSLPGGYLNCQHAVSDVLAGPGEQLLNTGLLRGFAASDNVFDWIMSSPYIIQPEASWDSVLGAFLY